MKLTKGTVTQTIEISHEHARLLIDRLSEHATPEVIDDDTLQIGAVTLSSSDMRTIMLTHVEMSTTLPSHYLALVNRKRRAPTIEETINRKKAKAKRGAYITIAQIAQQLGRTPRDCRATLRKLKVTKPPQGWSWPPHEANAIKARLGKKLKPVEEKPAEPLLSIH